MTAPYTSDIYRKWTDVVTTSLVHILVIVWLSYLQNGISYTG